MEIVFITSTLATPPSTQWVYTVDRTTRLIVGKEELTLDLLPVTCAFTTLYLAKTAELWRVSVPH